MLCLEYSSFNFHARLETSILSTRIVPLAGMDTTLLEVIVEVITVILYG